MKPIVFRYKPIRGRMAPLVTIGMKIGDLWYPLEVYADSGASYTVIHATVAVGVGFNYQAGERTYLQVGDGSFIPVYLHKLEVQLGGERFTAKIGFSEKLGIRFNLLGRADIFDRFKICFQEGQGILTFELAKAGT
ncbi:retropepsin-like domain-containing protein [candidate division KSB1 bacterium]|nr:retropepsin-like domain-containing protein [candidate division KSB1 bacterium]